MWHSIVSYTSLQARPEYGFTLTRGWGTKQGLVVLYAEQVYAYENRCPHQQVALNWSPHTFFDPNHEFIQCSMHGAWFQPDTGLCVRGPCLHRQLQSFPVRIEQGQIQVWFEFS